MKKIDIVKRIDLIVAQIKDHKDAINKLNKEITLLFKLLDFYNK